MTGPAEGINTVHDVLLYAGRTHGERKAYGVRDVIDIIEEQKEVTKTVGGKEVKETKTWKYFHLSDYKYISYTEFKSGVSEVSRGLLKLDLQKNDVFNIYAQTGYVTHFPPLFLARLPVSVPFLHPPPLSDVIPCHRGMADSCLYHSLVAQ
jgi:long-chain acyl-CoA synthetase